MPTSRSGIVLDGPSDTPELPPGSTQVARLRISLPDPPRRPTIVPVRLMDVPAGWKARAEPATVELSAERPSAGVDVHVTVPADQPDGDRSVWVRVDHDGGGAGLGLPVRVRAPPRRWGLAAATIGTAAAVAAGLTAWRLTRRQPAKWTDRLPDVPRLRDLRMPAMPAMPRLPWRK